MAGIVHTPFQRAVASVTAAKLHLAAATERSAAAEAARASASYHRPPYMDEGCGVLVGDLLDRDGPYATTPDVAVE